MRWVRKEICHAFSIYLLTTASYAAISHTELTVGGGYSRVNFNNLQLPVTLTETDTLHSGGDVTTFTETIGINESFVFDSICPSYSKNISNVAVGINFYNLSFTNTGTVYQFGDSSLNNLSYRLPVNSSRMMLDGKMTFSPGRQLSPFILAGVGAAWNRLSYSDTPVIAGISNINLEPNQQLKFAFEVGAGVQAMISQATSLYIEYLYADAGHARTSYYGNPNIVGAIEVPLHINSFLVGLNFSV